jgi:RNA polymerase sigma-70 factor (ECF subfamily)
MTESVANWVDEHSDFLYRFALARVRDASAAEDLVQETFLSALKSSGSGSPAFQNRSSARTWLAGILKHKIADHFRSKWRGALGLETEGSDFMDESFDGTYHWKEPPLDWKTSPEKLAENDELRKVLEECFGRLNERLRGLFVMREVDGLDTATLCKDFGISATNLWVLLHRARHQLKTCLEKNGVR